MDDTPLERVLLEEQTKELQEQIRRDLRRAERRGLKTAGKIMGSIAGMASLFVVVIYGINYLANGSGYSRPDGTCVESRVDGIISHTRMERAGDGGTIVMRYDPFERITTKIYIDSDDDGRVDAVYFAPRSDLFCESRGRIFPRGSAAIDFGRADADLAQALERFSE